MKSVVTAFDGKGMYTGNYDSVLLNALLVTETAELKGLVQRVYPNVFMIVTPA